MSGGKLRSRFFYGIALLLSAGLLLVLWEAAATGNATTQFFFSSPTAVAEALLGGLRGGEAWVDIAASAQETVGALAVGILLGVWLGFFALLLPPFRPVVAGLISVLAALPILALAPMFLIWFGVGVALKVALGAMLCALIATGQVLAADKVITRDLEEFLTANRITGSVALRKVVLPLAMPAALRRFPDAVNAAFLGVFIGEFVAADRGLGFRILRSGSLYAVDQVLAYTILALLLLLGLQVVVAAASALITRIVHQASLSRVARTGGP
jgi:NitT/TauT family transport system permease protein